ncbi:toll/interleukin-1 receptor domain-containing protein [uncultured Oscillibacter sp.]|uniref:toll/interleukin-1 receptor domain-containing protein n=1 Tax=uncultured Oscillibacter sp. TaxID=876091 RepID=UPI00262D10DF|nr:toll/interleukin-1 receptor domain-containing protein [uncultured Oscillibacter sp.]
MKIFISWSGSKSQEVAKILKQWIPCVIQSVEPYFSSADIDKGARWSTDIAKELQDASFGILCVTKDNLSSSWLNFEAGALSKSIEQSKVCPFLVDLKPSDIADSPILQFQMANATQDDVFKLFKSINSNLGDSKLSEDVLSTTFDTFWPKIEEALKSVSSITDVTTTSKKASKDVQAPIEEILELVRYQHKLLKSPEELLPAEYLLDIFKRTNRKLPRDLLMEIDEQLRIIDMIANDLLEGCGVKNQNPTDSPVIISRAPACVNKIQEIQERTKRLVALLRRNTRNIDFMF